MANINPFWNEEEALFLGSNSNNPAPAEKPKKKRTYTRRNKSATSVESVAGSALLPSKEVFHPESSGDSESEREETRAPSPPKQKKRATEDAAAKKASKEPARAAALEPVRAATLEPVRAAVLRSFLSQRVASGYTTQSDPAKTGEYYVELRVYNAREIERVAAVDRWKHSILSLKLGANTDTCFWKAVNHVVQAAKAEMNHIQPVLFPSNVF